jgi:putative transposase
LRKSRFTETQIVGIIKESEAGANTKELCRKHGVSPQTFYKWKAKYGGLEVSDVAKMRALEDENRRLKRIVADLTLNVDALNIVAQGKF